GLGRIDFLGASPGMWAIHPPYRSPTFYERLPALVAEIECGDVPDAQRGYHEAEGCLVDWSDVRPSPRNRLEKHSRLLLQRVRGSGNCPACQPAEILYEPAACPDGPPPRFGWIGANFAFRRRTAELVGEFDELLGAGAHFPVAEEIDFMRRAEGLGILMLTTP